MTTGLGVALPPFQTGFAHPVVVVVPPPVVVVVAVVVVVEGVQG